MKWVFNTVLSVFFLCVLYLGGFQDSDNKTESLSIHESILFAASVNADTSLQEEGEKEEWDEEEERADPGICMFCHMHAVEQWYESKHYKEFVDCIGCHGESDDHVRVEDNTIRPEIYFTETGTTDIKFCQETCHSELPQDPHEKVDDCCSCHLAHDFPPFRDVEVKKEESEE